MKHQIKKQDFNLLKLLHVLFQERSIQATANRVHLSPSAISKALQRLRIEFGDPLFISSNQGLTLTKNAEQIEVILKNLFDDVELFSVHKEFDKHAANGKIRIAAPEHFSIILIPKLLARLQRVSPNITLESLQLDTNYTENLRSGKIDFAVYINQDYPKELHALPIHSANPVFWVKKNHPLLKKNSALTLQDVFAHPQILFHDPHFPQSNRRYFLKKISDLGLTPDIAIETAHLLIALDVLLDTEAVMMAPDYLSLLPTFSEKIHPIPLGNIFGRENFKIDIALISHKKTLNSDLHQWISEEIVNIF